MGATKEGGAQLTACFVPSCGTVWDFWGPRMRLSLDVTQGELLIPSSQQPRVHPGSRLFLPVLPSPVCSCSPGSGKCLQECQDSW